MPEEKGQPTHLNQLELSKPLLTEVFQLAYRSSDSLLYL